MSRSRTQRIHTFTLELTARCNVNCRHCYINLPAGDTEARQKELSLDEIKKTVDDAVSLGAMWCHITGGEPLLRKDFADIYKYVKQKGFLVIVFTNATMLREEHIHLFKEYPPRDLEVSVYGVTRETYERVTRKPGSFDRFMRGLNLLFENKIPVRLKAVVIRSNYGEFKEIARFCQERTKDYFKFDPMMQLRYDHDPQRNSEIISERLTPAETVALERSERKRWEAMEEKHHQTASPPERCADHQNRILTCGAGQGSFTAGYDGFFYLCAQLRHPQTRYDLRQGNLKDAVENFSPQVRDLRTANADFLEKRNSPVGRMSKSCPAMSVLETGALDQPVTYFDDVASAEYEALKNEDQQGI